MQSQAGSSLHGGEGGQGELDFPPEALELLIPTTLGVILHIRIVIWLIIWVLREEYY